ncbi:helix-turn-helix domain-containing protein [Eubacterium barkeri]|uniref:Helix-turn-helix n=1 Tax=Eubacterium barkeri TaxID=1528 RepID=A0A1H3BHV0_EUBBA|nr:helix-turn-helix transcriptional regulator [Eubacterium barkeri]SDX40924.1 Helix-turn-helix [Eubacterium barkeri]
MSDRNDRFKELRLSLGKSQREIGDAIGLSNSGISSIESNQRSVTEKHIKLLVAAFNVNETWLRTGEGEMFIKTQAYDLAEIASRYHLDDMDRRMLTAYLELPADARAVIKDYIHSVASTPLDATSTDDRAALHKALDAELDAEKVGQMSEAFTDGNLKEKSS